MKSEHYTIQDIKDGKVAIFHNKTKPSLDNLRKLIKICFPKDVSIPKGWENLYGRDFDKKDSWESGSNYNHLPSRPASYFLEQVDKRFPFTLSQIEVQDILNVACPAWKQKLSKLWGADYIQGNPIIITEEFYREMRSACTDSQNGLFDSIFGSDIEWFPNHAYLVEVSGVQVLRVASDKVEMFHIDGKLSGPTSKMKIIKHIGAI